VKKFFKRALLALASLLAALVLALVLIFATGAFDRWARPQIIAQVEKATGGRVELKGFEFNLFELRAVLRDFTIHGHETPGMPPFFHADELLVDVRLDSLWSRKFSLDEVRVDRPFVHIRTNPDGSSNVPLPKPSGTPGRPWRERIFTLAIRKLRINDGHLLYNNTRIPLVAQGGRFDFALDYNAPTPAEPRYEGDFAWQKMALAARRYLPFSSDIKVKFWLSRTAFEVSELTWKLPQSAIRASVGVDNLANPSWKFRYDVKLALQDIRRILRKPNSPGGNVEAKGEGSWSNGELSLKGTYVARGIEMPYQWFHAKGIESRGTIQVAKRKLLIPDFQAALMGGEVRGRVLMDFDGVRFRAETRAERLCLACVLDAVNNPSFPIDALHWNAQTAVDAVTTWEQDFKHLATRGRTSWSPQTQLDPGDIPVSATIDFDYSVDRSDVILRQSEIVTPSSHLKMDGVLGSHNSSLAVNLKSSDLLPWNDLINRLRGEKAEPKRIAGAADWQGRVLGNLASPQFVGHAKGRNIAYDRLYWDEAEGDVVYSREELRLRNMRARRGNSSADLELYLQLDDWSFQAESEWKLDVSFVRATTDEIQALLGWSYPVRGLLTTRLIGRGTRSHPELSGPFELTELQGYGVRLARARGAFALGNDVLKLTGLEVSDPIGRVQGDFIYRMETRDLEFDATGSDVLLERIAQLQTARLPLGGRLNFKLRGRGPLAAPEAEGDLTITSLRVGGETLGNLVAKLSSRGRDARLELSSSMNGSSLHGQVQMRMAGTYPVQGEISVKNFDLDSFIQAATHLSLSGHGSVTGKFTLSGDAAKPETLAVLADISDIKFEYERLKFQNDGPLRVAYRREEIRIEQAHIRGPETDFTLSGYARFAERRPVQMRLNGTVSLSILGGFVPQLEARGMAQVNASVEGTLNNPRVIGSVRVKDAAANYGDFPAGLSRVNGDFVFDANRMVFEGVRAEAGGGTLTLGGSLAYGEGPVRYDLNVSANRVRVRYPAGATWLADGTLRLNGTGSGGVLSGRVQVHRVFLGEGLDFSAMMVASQSGAAGPASTSRFLRNLLFDIEATTAPNALLELTTGRFETEATLRVRGTGERPIFLGNIHLITGDMRFRGNRYQLTRGDINFKDPFKFDPSLDLEATTTIQQYEITVNFSGPASKLSLAYRSDPPLPPNDIIALLALGRSADEDELRSGRAAGGGTGASALLSEAISSQLGGRIERLFGISRFRFDPFVGASTGTSTGTQSLGRITIEQQVARDLLITYSTDVNSTEQQVIQVEYNVNRGLSILGLRDKNGTFALEVKFKKRFK